jgi:hypothetical protein
MLRVPVVPYRDNAVYLLLLIIFSNWASRGESDEDQPGKGKRLVSPSLSWPRARFPPIVSDISTAAAAAAKLWMAITVVTKIVIDVIPLLILPPLWA